MIALLTFVSFAAFFLQAIVVIVIAVALSSKELLVKPIEVPDRVKIEHNKNSQKRALPKGESINEIFGELKPKAKE